MYRTPLIYPYVTFQMAEVLVSKSLFYEILERIKRLRPVPIEYD
jgi:hypothetical protein